MHRAGLPSVRLSAVPGEPTSGEGRVMIGKHEPAAPAPLPSGGMVDVGLDHPAAVVLAREFLPATGATFGHGDRPQAHWLYVCGAPGRTRRWTAPDGAATVQVRSPGGQ